MKIIELDPDTWIRGNVIKDDSCLLSPDGNKCCMGFAALAFGATDEDIAGADWWANCRMTALKERDAGADAKRFRAVYMINDDDDYASDTERIANLNKELESLGEDFRFALKGAAPTPQEEAGT